ncbi:ankyrin repeat and KH domain-containing protein mask-1-like [Dendronephthya gigantea]|uniref:ankyrin repeat and KH domain-containing protein mask-1-like n=1 Tax=Dendronephthya gigantea TaxID=151771 RepID=UPI0010692E95|nr:ankyrin repeat and KH domain-containing protein mask-1-like [Dendronephthya gigantea]
MLIEAIKQGRVFMVKYLLDCKAADVNETDKDGQTPLISACLLDDNMSATRRKLVRLFLVKNANVNMADSSGRNALMWACHLGKIDVVKILFGRSLMDLDFTCTDPVGNTALHYVSSAGHYPLTSMLVEAMNRFGVSLDRRNNEGMTPLLAATKSGNEMCANVLLENGASPDIVDPETLLNVKELAEDGKLSELLEKITIRSPRTQSRCMFPRQPDDDDMRSTIRSPDRSRGTTRDDLKQPDKQSSDNRVKETRTPLVGKRKEKGSKTELKSGKLNTTQNRPKTNTRDIAEIRSRSPCINFIPCPRPTSQCNIVPPQTRETRSAQPGINGLTNPYDLRNLQSVLSLYGEQTAPGFRKGFTTPGMSSEDFQHYLEELKVKEKRRTSHQLGFHHSPLQHRRRSALLKEHNLRRSSDPTHNCRRHSVNPSLFQRGGLFDRNLSHLIDLQLPVRTNNQRRHTIMVSTPKMGNSGF